MLHLREQLLIAVFNANYALYLLHVGDNGEESSTRKYVVQNVIDDGARNILKINDFHLQLSWYFIVNIKRWRENFESCENSCTDGHPCVPLVGDLCSWSSTSCFMREHFGDPCNNNKALYSEKYELNFMAMNKENINHNKMENLLQFNWKGFVSILGPRK